MPFGGGKLGGLLRGGLAQAAAASQAAAELAEKTGLDREETIDLAVSYILAGVQRIATG